MKYTDTRKDNEPRLQSIRRAILAQKLEDERVCQEWVANGCVGRLVRRGDALTIEACAPEEDNDWTIHDYDMGAGAGSTHPEP